MTKIGYSNVFSVKIAGRTLDQAVAPLLVAGHVDFGAGVPGSFQLTFRDQKKKVLGLTGAKIGADVELAAVSDGQGAQFPLLTGEITGLETDYDGTGTFTVIRGYDLGHRMLRQRRVVAYRNMTASDIARRLAGQDKVPTGTVQATKIVYEFITQANVTDWDFLSRLADENEMVMSVSSRGKLQLVKPDPASGAPSTSTPSDNNPLVLKAGNDILRCRVSVTSADQVSKAEARGWDVTTKKPLVGRSVAAANPGFEIGTTPAKAVSAFGTATLVETDIPYDKQDEVKNAASALADDVTAAFAEVEVTAHGNPNLRPGVPVTLADVGDPFEGKYTVTGARHSFGDHQHYTTFLTVSGRQWRSLYGLTSGGAGNSPRLPSVANALVTDIKDPLKQGRVKLKFPWLDDSYVSDWTRTVQFGGTKGGGVIAPDVNDEVLVAFDRGALDHPFVIGGLYNGRDKPPPGDVPLVDPTSGKATRHTLADRSGNRLDLLDQRTGGKRGVRLKTGDDKLTINMDRTGTEITVDSKGKVTIRGTTSVSVRAGRDLSLQAGRNLTIKAGGLINVLGQTISVRALTAFNVNALDMNLSATAMANISSVGNIQLNSVADIGIKAINVSLFGIVTANTQLVVVV
ncbi:VgrG-related protein [Actinacidiphila oryziradicis]|jgi:phage protein D|uniref:VgrG-related protein n=1 Tax=Actinacidiphila oryziradicis TaxID=2571141 RepID=UPI0023F1C368|nr:VgrG-related protein [Actinacidiphila oryziradicis]MCW2872430.1 type secretion protein Rhs [Actinacidiphila oryziradicis]